MGLEVQVQQPVGKAAPVLGGDPVLKPGESGLGGQVRATLRGLAGHDLEGWIPGEPSGVVVVLVTQGNGEQPLPHQGEEIVSHFGGIPRVMETRSRLLGDTVALIQLPEQQAPGIRGYPATLKIGDDFLMKKAFKTELFMAKCFHRVCWLRG